MYLMTGKWSPTSQAEDFKTTALARTSYPLCSKTRQGTNPLGVIRHMCGGTRRVEGRQAGWAWNRTDVQYFLVSHEIISSLPGPPL